MWFFVRIWSDKNEQRYNMRRHKRKVPSADIIRPRYLLCGLEILADIKHIWLLLNWETVFMGIQELPVRGIIEKLFNLRRSEDRHINIFTSKHVSNWIRQKILKCFSITMHNHWMIFLQYRNDIIITVYLRKSGAYLFFCTVCFKSPVRGFELIWKSSQKIVYFEIGKRKVNYKTVSLTIILRILSFTASRFLKRIVGKVLRTPIVFLVK